MRRNRMRMKLNTCLGMATLVGLLAGASGTVVARGWQSAQESQSQPPAQQGDKPKTPDVTPLTLDAPAPVNAEEDDAYLQAGNTQKMQEYGEKEITLSPNDVSTLALLGQTLPRTLHGSVSDPAAVQLLAKAEQYSKQAIEITPTLPKPENLTDEAFASAKNQTLAMAHSGLGLVFVRRGKNAEAIPQLEQAVKIDPNPDPVNYYLLGMANKSTSHFDDAVAAFNKCAAMTGPLQGTCKTQAEDAKKLGTTQLSAPK